MVEAVGGGIGGGDVFGLVDGFLTNDLDPVSIRIKGEGNTPHAPVGQFLLKLVSSVFDALTSGLNIVHTDTNMTKAFVGVFIAVVDGVRIVRLGAIVVGQFENTLTVAPVCACRCR